MLILKKIIKKVIKNKYIQILLNLAFISINIVLVILLFVGLKDEDIEDINELKFKYLLYSYKYIEAIYQISVALYGFYTLYVIYNLNQGINKYITITYFIITGVLIILKAILMFIIYTSYKDSDQINDDVRLNIILSLVSNCVLFSIMLIMIIFQLYYYSENGEFYDINDLVKNIVDTGNDLVDGAQELRDEIFYESNKN